MKIKFIFLLLVVITIMLFSSCTRLMMYAWDLHMPEPKEKIEVLNYLKTKNINIDNVIYVKSETDWFKLMGYTTELICFNKEKNFYWYKDTSSCNAKAFSYCDSVCQLSIPQDRINTNFKLDSLLAMTEDFNGNTIAADDADFTIIIGWARYSGKLNVDHVKVWEESLSKIKGCNVKVYKLCLDPLKKWGPPSYEFSNRVTKKEPRNTSISTN